MNYIFYFLVETIFSIYYYQNKSDNFNYLKIILYFLSFVSFELLNVFLDNNVFLKVFKGSVIYLLIEYLFGKIFEYNEIFSTIFMCFLQLSFNFIFNKKK
jgi:hypothetical protein